MSEEYHFDERAASVAVNFFEKLLVHSKGEWSGKSFTLQAWQRDEVIKPLFGWKRQDGTRKFRRAYIEIPRKNGKSTLSSGIALYLLFADDEPGAEIYSAAADRDQAGIVFEQAKEMVEASQVLSKRAQVFKRSIVVQSTRSSYKVLSADAYSKHGLNAHGVIFDELHAQPNRDLWDVLNTSTGARRQPLMVSITTAGYDRNSVCWEQHEYARQVKEGIIDDPSFFAFIAAADTEDDWLDEHTWYKSNPSLGATIKLEYLQEEARRAEQTPAYQNTFRRLHLNQWTQQETRWLDMKSWDACDKTIDEKLLDGAECYGGLDLASTSDVAAFVLCFPPENGEDGYYVWQPYFFIPKDNMIDRARKDRVPYDAWTRDGYINATDGNTIDYSIIVNKIVELGERYNIKEIAFDRWGAFQVSQQLQGAGFTMVGFGQGFVSMSGPTKELLKLTLSKKIIHGGNPVLRWMADNLVVDMDAAGNIKPNKQKSREKIDGMVAGVMALDRAIRHADSGGKSIYEARGIISL